MIGYTKLFSSILMSTIWLEDDKTRIVWITLLAASDQHGVVEGSIPGLAKIANVSVPDCEMALEKLQQPDKYSRSPEHEGRRIEVIDGGWLILNREKYREKLSEDDRRRRDRERQRRHRESVTSSVTQACDMSRSSQQAEAENSRYREEEETEAESDRSELILKIWHTYPKNKHRQDELQVPRADCDSIIEAVARDGDKVLAGTEAYLKATNEWPAHERKFIKKLPQFMAERDYLKDPSEWQRDEPRKHEEPKKVYPVNPVDIIRKQKRELGHYDNYDDLVARENTQKTSEKFED